MKFKNKILIVDDSPAILNAVKSLIDESYVYEPFYASTFEETRQLIEEHHFFVALLALELPDTAPGEVVDYAISHKIHSIVLIGTFNEARRKQILEKQIVDYIVKNSLEDIKNALSIAENLTFFDQKTVLIVDDNHLARMQLRMMFEALSFFVVEAVSGNEALEKITNLPHLDIIIIDYEMPEMNGVELIQKIRKMSKIFQPIIFAVTSSASEMDKAKFLKNGVNDYFIKPVQKEEFNYKLGNYLRILNQNSERIKSQRVVDEYNRALRVGSYVTKANLHGIIIFVSENFAELTGYTVEELIGKPHSIFRHPNTSKTTFKELWNAISKKEIWSGVLKNQKKDGKIFYVRTTIVPIFDNNLDIIEYVALRDEVSELIASQKKLQPHFKTDFLTSLGNRVKLIDDLEIIDNPSLALVNIVNFKEIKREYGYRIGNDVLIWVGEILYDFSIDTTIDLYRLNGDEFAILTSKMSFKNFQELLFLIAAEVKNSSFNIGLHRIPIKIKIGISTGENDILLHADIALKEVKTISEDILVYHEGIKVSQEYKNNLFWKSKIIDGIKNNLFVPYYQSIVDNQTGVTHKFEALIRLKDGDTVISPVHFLELSKKSRYYFELTMIMIRKTFEMFRDNEYEFAINFSVQDVQSEEVLYYFRNMIYKHSGIQKRITIEIVESEVIENFEVMNLFINQMKVMGCKIAIDDFGIGYLNFEYLAELKVDFIKIDGSIIGGLGINSHSNDIVESIVSYANKNNIKTIGEFVSNEELYTQAKALGIDYSQGYYFSEPMEKF
ncbi:MAG: EAL domain-containing protein [Campylobacterales bacterium]|nr:EAL domain-containing protein [Campylobacterales bacterium]